ncbi:MAG TPA: PASTA domain-containing protein, partial [Sedimentisphaerales bacterium]|nr:PASTA domain-containing protein [Sedimentisphaerales bacterium]
MSERAGLRAWRLGSKNFLTLFSAIKHPLVAILLPILIAAVGANAGYTATGSSDEVNTLAIFQHLFGADVSGQQWCGSVYTNGTITAVRIQDYIDPYSPPGAPGDNIYLLSGSLSPTATDQYWVDGHASSTATARYAHYDQRFGYDAGSGFVEVINVNSVYGFIDVPGIPVVFGPGSVWQWARVGNGRTWYSAEANNSDARDHLIAYLVTGLNNGKITWVLFWDDQKDPDADRDFNDLVVVIEALPVVPNVVGLTEYAAGVQITVVDNLQLGNVTYEYSETVEAGLVISQDPNAGTPVQFGSSVDIVVSLGPHAVPNVIGMQLSDANTAIIDAGFSVGSLTYVYSDTQAGIVLGQTPVGGAIIPIGSPVDLVVSRGQPFVPDVQGMTQASAESTITSVDNLQVSVSTAYHDTVPADYVISQDPAAGTQVPVGSTVNILVSLGHAPVTVPDVRNTTEAQAEAALNAVGLNKGAVTTSYSDTVPADLVISSNPSGGTSVDYGSSVDLVISLGHALVTVPSVLNMTESQAEAALNAVGLNKGAVTTSYSDTVPVDLVISSNPSAGTSVAYGSSVDLVISLGRAPVTVPDVLNMTESQAEAALNAVGLNKGSVTTSYSDTVPVDLVISSNPSAGAYVAYGSSVDLVISLGHAPVTVPDVLNMTESQAEAALNAVGLNKGAVTTSYSDTVPVDLVISSNPSAGTSVAYGSSVDLVISLGRAPVTVPSVLNMTESQAEAALNAVGLNKGAVTTSYGDTVPADLVIASNPSAGASVAYGSSVDLVISLGHAPVTIPDVRNMTESQAEAALNAVGLNKGAVTTSYGDTV